jgi:hypothetical protein
MRQVSLLKRPQLSSRPMVCRLMALLLLGSWADQ